MKLTILGVDVECVDKVLYATEELSREYIKDMKDTNGKTITEEEFMKDIGHGVERTQENWKEEFDKKLPLFTFVNNSEYGSELKIEEVKDFISTLLAEERHKVLSEERQFILNILDGIDIADKEMGLTGGTQAIRQALQSRI